MNRRFTFFTICFLIASTLLGYSQGTAPAGTGTSIDPYQIDSLSNLEWMVNNPSKWGPPMHYVLTSDIDASATSTWNDGKGFKPIGNATSPIYNFMASFDGQGYEISNLTINRPDEDNIGMFGVTGMGATIKNLNLTNVNISGKSQVGAILGSGSANIIMCSSSGSVSGAGANVAGIVGKNRAGVVKFCYSTATVSGTSNVSNYCGGIAGWGPAISHCFFGGTVSGYDNVGGIVGLGGGVVSDSYAFGTITSTGPSKGGVAGNASDSRVSASYWDKETTGLTARIGSSTTNDDYAKYGLNTVQFADLANLPELASSVWEVATDTLLDSVARPYFKWFEGGTTIIMSASPAAQALALFGEGTYQVGDSVTLEVTPAQDYMLGSWTAGGVELSTENPYKFKMTDSTAAYITANLVFDPSTFSGGTGTEQDPFIITTLDQLKLVSEIRSLWAYHYKLGADIDASETANWTGSDPFKKEGFSPIGGTSRFYYFTGSFDGAGYEVSGLTINRTTSNNGLFSQTKNATLKNITLVDCNIKGGMVTGGLVAKPTSTTIDSCYVSGTVNGKNLVGGLVGYLYTGTKVKNCVSDVDVTASGATTTSDAGGFIGRAYTNAGPVELSYSTGTVTGDKNNVGGFIGYNAYASNILNCFTTSEVNGVDYVGGFVGNSNTMNKIDTCYSAGAVKAGETATNVGGFAGASNKGAGVCYWDSTTAGVNQMIGGAAPVIENGFESAAFAVQDSFPSWNFDDIWEIGYVSSISDVKRPYFQGMNFEIPTATKREMELGMNAYPNPTSDRVNVTNINVGSTVNVFSQFGQCIYTKIADDSMIQIDLINQPTGMYFIKVDNNPAIKIIKN